MAVFNMMFPVLPGREDDARKFAEEALGSHRRHFEGVQKGTGTSRETWTIQETPAGTVVLVWGEGDDVEAGFEYMATATGEDIEWMRGRIKDVSGIDMTEPDDGPLPDVILDWSA
ncbi:MAG: hypothetical protein ACE5EV_08545 [Gaiellales bacterium]